MNQWKKLVGLITAFTAGHSLTLALSVDQCFAFRQNYTEFFMVPLANIITAGFVLFFNKNAQTGKIIYLIICALGNIGMGFCGSLLRWNVGHENVIVPADV